MEFAVTEGGKVIAFPAGKISEALEFQNGAWVPFRGICGTLWRAKPITESEAIALTSGVMPS